MKTAEIMGRLRAASLPKMEAFQTDLDHDERWINDNQGAHFLHVCTKTSTHILPCPLGYGADLPIRYLFGTSRPSEIARQSLSCIDSAIDGSLWQDGQWHYFDGRRLVAISVEAARVFFADYVRRSESLLRRAG